MTYPQNYDHSNVTQIFDLLLEKNFDFNHRDKLNSTAFHNWTGYYIQYFTQQKYLDCLVKYGVDFNIVSDSHNSLLFSYLCDSNVTTKKIQFLIDHKARIDLVDNGKQSYPLLVECSERTEPYLEMLLLNKADPFIQISVNFFNFFNFFKF